LSSTTENKTSLPHPDPETLDDKHVCHWTEEYALLAREKNILDRQLRANDRSKQTMARNCRYYDLGNCAIDMPQRCKQQCGKKGARIDHEKEMLYYE